MTAVACWHDAVGALRDRGLVRDRGDVAEDDRQTPVVEVPDWSAAAATALALAPEPYSVTVFRAALDELAGDPELAAAVEVAYALAGRGWPRAVLDLLRARSRALRGEAP